MNYTEDTLFGNFDVGYSFAPVGPGFISAASAPPPPSASPNANLPSNMGIAADPLPVQFASLMPGQSASYRIVAGAALNSANPLALANASNFAAGAPLAGEGNVLVKGDTILNGLNGTAAAIAAPTTIRTGTGSIDIAAAGNFELQDQLAPGVVYTAGAPVQSPAGGDSTTIALSLGAFDSFGRAAGIGVSTILTPEVNPANAGNITLTVAGNIMGIQNVTDTLAQGMAGDSFDPSAPSGLSSNPGAFLGQFWVPWLLTNSIAPNVPWYVNFGSFDQGIMSVGGNVTISAGGDIRDLGVSLPTTSYLDASNALHITGGGNLSVTAGGNIYSGDFYVGQGAGAVQSGGVIASDFTFESASLAYPVQTLLAVQYGTIAVQARGSVDIGGVYDPTYLVSPTPFGSNTGALPVVSYSSVSSAAVDLEPYVTSMSPTSGVSIQTTGGDVTFNSLLEQEALFDLGQPVKTQTNKGFDLDASITSLLLPASLSLVALDGGIMIDHGGGLYPSATGTLTIVADQSINLSIPVLLSAVPTQGDTSVSAELPNFATWGGVSGTTLGKLDEQVGTGILPTGADPASDDPTLDTPAQLRDPSLSQDDDTASVLIYSLNGSLLDGGPLPILSSVVSATNIGSAVGQISLIPNAPAQIYAGRDILDLPFYGENFTPNDITSITAGNNISYNINGYVQPPAIELAGPGALDIIAGGDISFPPEADTRNPSETGIRTLGNSIDASANPDPSRPVPVNGKSTAFLSQFGNPYLPNGGASVNVLFGVHPGMDTSAFIASYVNPATVSTTAYQDDLTSFVTQYEENNGTVLGGDPTPTQAWAIFEKLPAAQQQLLVEQVFFDILNTTGLNYNNPASATFHQYDAGYQAINTLFPASYGYTVNALDTVNGAAQLITTG